MNKETAPATVVRSNTIFTKLVFLVVAAIFLALIFAYYPFTGKTQPGNTTVLQKKDTAEKEKEATVPSFSFKEKLQHMINGDSSGKWPANKSEPLEGALLPYNRIVAFYGNLYSKNMGILGELPKQEMLDKLLQESKQWQDADTMMQVVPALHYIAVTAQNLPGKANKYRLRMPFHQIDSILKMAEQIKAIVFLDIQVGLSTLEEEVPELEKYLKLPHVHLGIDPEFSMKGGQKPGTVIGSFDAADINFTINYLEQIVKDNNLPPKVLVIHRFTQGMVKNYKDIKLKPQVQIVMDMDGWGHPAKKINTYKQFIYREPVEYTGFKIFYKNDTKNMGRLLTHKELLNLKPRPVYIQYQ